MTERHIYILYIVSERLDNRDYLADSILWSEYSCGKGENFQCLILLAGRDYAIHVLIKNPTFYS